MKFCKISASDYLVNKCPKNYSNNSEFEGWVQGTYAQDRNAYYNNDQGDIEWNEKHLKCEYNNAIFMVK